MPLALASDSAERRWEEGKRGVGGLEIWGGSRTREKRGAGGKRDYGGSRDYGENRDYGRDRVRRIERMSEIGTVANLGSGGNMRWWLS